MSHQKHISELAAAHEAQRVKLLDLSIHEELRKIKAEFAKSEAESVRRAITEATQHTRAIMSDEIRSLQASHTATLAHERSLHQQEIAKLRSEWNAEHTRSIEEAHAKSKANSLAETEAAIAKQRVEMLKKGSIEMKALGDAHSAKTASLENEIAELKATLHADEGKARRASDLERQLESQSKELTHIKSELATTKTKLKELELENSKFVSVC
jgi:hypothetical protein